MLTLTSEYALRAMVEIARQHDGGSVTGGELASRTGVPSKYLSKVLADLVRCGVLEATRGKSGGFRMTRAAEVIPLGDVLSPFEPALSSRRSCPFGNMVCNGDDSCAGHESWKKVRQAYEAFLTNTSVRDIAEADGVRLRPSQEKRKSR